MKKACVAIPVYKPQPSRDEELALRQCFSVLRRHPIFLVTHPKLNLGAYEKLAAECGAAFQTKLFKPSFFADIGGYNRLTKSPAFYQAFADFEYFLLYQTDAWVFSDELEYWCGQNYDYIGAPWIPGGGAVDLSPYDGHKFVKSGNGGFSLRRTEYFIRLLAAKGAVFTEAGIERKVQALKAQGGAKNLLRIFALKSGIANRMSVVKKSKRSEDRFYISNFAEGISNHEMNVPEPETALKFAFEQWPAFLYEQNGGKLPFGCHGWRRYEYESFYSRFIKAEYEP